MHIYHPASNQWLLSVWMSKGCAKWKYRLSDLLEIKNVNNRILISEIWFRDFVIDWLQSSSFKDSKIQIKGKWKGLTDYMLFQSFIWFCDAVSDQCLSIKPTCIIL